MPNEEQIYFSNLASVKTQLLTLWFVGEAEPPPMARVSADRNYSPAPTVHSCPPHDMRPESSGFYWMVGMTKDFKKAIREIDRKLQGRILEAINEITEHPVTPNGDTVKPLTGDMKEFWRYRIGDYRLVYLPNREKHQVTLWTFAARGGVYD